MRTRPFYSGAIAGVVRRILLPVAALMLLFPDGARAEAPQASTPAPAAEAAAAQAPAPATCTALAELFGEKICQEQIDLKSDDFPKLRQLSDRQIKKFLEKTDARNLATLRAEIWKRALVHKFGEAALKPSPEDIEKYRAHFTGTMDTSYEADKKAKALIEESLAKNHYKPSDEKKLKDTLNAVSTSVQFYEERQKHTASLPEQYRFVVAATESRIAEEMLTSWKMNKILFDTYGGRLVAHGSEIEPIDAYAAFIKYIHAEGKLKSLDPSFASPFKPVEDFIAAKHKPIPETDAMRRNYFMNPFWQFELANTGDRVGELKKWIDSLHPLGPASP